MNNDIPCMELEIFQGQKIARDGDLVSATDMWKLAERPKNKNPKYWLRISTTIEHISFLEKEMVKGDSGSPLELVKIARGKYGNIFLHWKLALMYAAYLSPAFRDVVFSTFAKVFQADVAVADDIYQRATLAQQKWLEARIKGKKDRRLLTDEIDKRKSTDAAFGECTNAIYRNLFDQTARELVVTRHSALVQQSNTSIAPKDTRDYMDEYELAAVDFSEVLSRKRMIKKDDRGDSALIKTCAESSRDVRVILEK